MHRISIDWSQRWLARQREVRMLILAAISVTCWLCALIAIPRRPLPGNEIEELVYGRLLGRHQHLALFAFAATAVTFFALVAALPHKIAATSDAPPAPGRICVPGSGGVPTCYTPQPEGVWVTERLAPDGTWQVEAVSMTAPPQAGEAGEAQR